MSGFLSSMGSVRSLSPKPAHVDATPLARSIGNNRSSSNKSPAGRSNNPPPPRSQQQSYHPGDPNAASNAPFPPRGASAQGGPTKGQTQNDRLYLCLPFVKAALVKGNFKTIVALPKCESSAGGGGAARAWGEDRS